MRAGLLKDSIKILQSETITDEFGSSLEALVKYIETRAYINYNNGSRGVINEEIQNVYNYTFTIRSYHQIDEKMVIEWKGRKYMILSIDNTQKDRTIINAEIINE